MTIKRLPATEVKNRFGRLLREIARTGGPVIVERGGKPVAVILSIEEYERRQRQALAAETVGELAVNSFGMWADRQDIGESWLAEGRAQWNSRWRDDREP